MARDIIHEAILALRADTTQLRTDLQQGKTIFSNSLRDMQGIARQLVPVLSVGGIVALGKQFIDLGDRLSDLSDQTGHSVAVLGGLKPLLDRNGSSIEGFAKSASIAQKNLGDLTKDVGDFLKGLGINVTELKQASPDEFIEKLSQSLAKIEDRNVRAAAASKILGRSFGELGPTILEVAEKGLPRLSEQAEAGWKALGKLADTISTLTGVTANFFAGVIGAGFVDKLAELGKKAEHVQTQLDKLKGVSDPFLLQRKQALQSELLFLSREIQDLQEQRDRQVAPGRPPVVPEVDTESQKKVESFVEGLKKQADALRVNIEEATKGGLAAKSLGLDIEFAGLKGAMSAPQFAKLKDEIIGLSRSFAQAQLEGNLLKQTLEGMEAAFPEPMMPGEIIGSLSGRSKAEAGGILSRGDIQIIRDKDAAELAKLADMWDQDSTEMADAAERLAAKINTELGDALRLIAGETQVFGGAFDSTTARIDATTNAIRQLIAEGFDPLGPEIQKLKADLQGLEEIRALENVFHSVGDALQTMTQGVLMGTQEWGDLFRNLLRNIALNAAMEFNRNFILKPLGLAPGGAGGGLLGGLLGGFSSENIEGFFTSWAGWYDKGGPVKRRSLPHFESGGMLSVVHDGEYVLRKPAVQGIGAPALDFMNETGRMPARERERPIQLKVDIHGDIIPNPGVRPDQVVAITGKNLSDPNGVLRRIVKDMK